MRFSANVSILFKEVPFLERFGRAAKPVSRRSSSGGLRTRTSARSSGQSRDAGLEVALFNFDAGDMPAGDRGLVGDPEREQRFRENVPVALELARALGCQRMNVLVGHEYRGHEPRGTAGAGARKRRFAAGRAETAGVRWWWRPSTPSRTGRICCTRRGRRWSSCEGVERENVRVQHDLYHMQRMEGNLVANLREHVGVIGHVQIADSPGRGEPGTGEIHYPYVLAALEDLGYDGFVGLEYNPTTDTTEESFGWLPRDLSGGDVAVIGPETLEEERAMADTVGFIGLGIMGKPMAKNLIEAGHELVVYNRTQEKAEELAGDGATVAASPKEVAEKSDVVITMLPGLAAGRGGPGRRRRGLRRYQRRRSDRGHEHDLAGRHGRARGEGRERGRFDARCSGLRRRRWRHRGYALDHGRRIERRTSSGRARSSR